jgi:hypothetical protein
MWGFIAATYEEHAAAEMPHTIARQCPFNGQMTERAVL